MDKPLDLLKRLGVETQPNGDLSVYSPIDGAPIATLQNASNGEIEDTIARAKAAFIKWRDVPAPRRGELVRLWGEELRKSKEDIAQLISLEVGKILQEGLGEVQEAIDMCDLCVGQSRQLFGRTITSERASHRIMEQWHPLGPVAIITAFNFPCAVFAWNAANALICGDSIILKPSEKSPLSGMATLQALLRAIDKFGSDAPGGLAQGIIGGVEQSKELVYSRDIALVSATGSTEMGRSVAVAVAERFGKRILELGGNNAMIVTEHANLELALRAIVFGAVGTAGQRCTSLRRLFIHHTQKDALIKKIKTAYASLNIGNPLEDQSLVGPLIDAPAYMMFKNGIQDALDEGGTLLIGGERVLEEQYPDGYYVSPAVFEMPSQTQAMKAECFTPILYIVPYEDFDQALEMHNDVPQGLSSCIISDNMREVERFISASGSDCGMANVNIGPSGAEIGGAFGGEKETGGDRETGSDAWKNYMRRTTNSINYSTDMPLAQGISFGD
ncbi:Aldehyde dehydrogenase [Candidatus Terasakiella magnetica]|uniref:aldehyde dehydrogenase (NAD(+)) n=1 Tax=Candidatus Terasakiella magnetica TaxID=1867952 RepID=A0A1C3RJP4_9PROT|nr:aldehyde dehydrogenase family protein [Candidatus Terasakiella magnetica]SCA57502.1 Aldehyde dehydrogenase [Candidatus Terasakiella magnetica]